jgi:hypothetical protein
LLLDTTKPTPSLLLHTQNYVTRQSASIVASALKPSATPANCLEIVGVRKNMRYLPGRGAALWPERTFQFDGKEVGAKVIEWKPLHSGAVEVTVQTSCPHRDGQIHHQTNTFTLTDPSGGMQLESVEPLLRA